MAKRKAGVVEIDFGHEDAKGGGGRVRLPEGEYKARISGVKQEEAQSGNQMLVWTLQITEGKHKGKKIIDRTVLVPKALFRLRMLLEACGKTVPEKAIKLKYRDYVGEDVGIVLEDDEYEGRISSTVAEYVSLDVIDDEQEDDEDYDDEEEEDDEEDDDEDEEEEDLEEVDLDEL